MADPNAHQDEEVNNLESEDFKKEKSPNLKTPSYQAERPDQRVLAKVDTSINFNCDNISEVNEQIEDNIVRNAENMWECKVCGRSFARKDHLKQHVETHLEGVSFDCPMCEKTFRSRNALAIHKHRNH